MKILKYILCTHVNHGTEENPQIEEILSPVEMGWNEINEEIAKREAYNGEYEIVDDGESEHPKVFAPRNILVGEYITVNGTMYKALSNIPNGERIITGQNAIETTVEEQLAELAKGE